MTIEEIRDALKRAQELRVPRRSREVSTRQLVGALEDYMLQVAYARGDCEVALYYLDRLYDKLRQQWRDMTGYETFLPNKARDRLTRDDIDDAKAKSNTVLHDQLVEVRRLREGVSRQIGRLGGNDHDAVSRAYTLISGA